jgi:hypothetical protein
VDKKNRVFGEKPKRFLGGERLLQYGVSLEE